MAEPLGTPGSSPAREDATLERGSPMEAFGWHSRGHLPHFDSPHVIQHVTFHLADSLPAEVRMRLEEELRIIPPERQEEQQRILDEARSSRYAHQTAPMPGVDPYFDPLSPFRSVPPSQCSCSGP